MKYHFLIGILVALALPMYGQSNINNNELEQNLAPVEFINNEKIPAKIDTRLQIWQIGNSLGLAVSKGATKSGQNNRYFVIHCRADEENKMDADIFGLGPGVGVDHIRNLRTILQGYLEGAYGYAPKDALLLAQYVTIYNAVFRGNLEYMQARYNSLTIENLVPEKIGLDTHYAQWAGKTLMIIPIGSGKPGSPSVSPTVLTEPEVIEEVEKEDNGTELKKDMIKILEDEADKAEKEATKLNKESKEEKAAVKDAKAKLEKDKATVSKEEAEDREKELDKRDKAADAKQEEAKKLVTLGEEMTERAQDLRDSIGEDKDAPTEEPAAEPEEPAVLVMGVTLNNQLTYVGKLVKINKVDGKIMQSSALNSINARALVIKDKAIYALSSDAASRAPASAVASLLGGQAVAQTLAQKLVKIDPDTLETLAEGTDEIIASSLLWENKDAFYAVVTGDGGSYQLARFDSDLSIAARSEVAVHLWAALIFDGKIIVTQKTDGSVLFLNADDLKEAK